MSLRLLASVVADGLRGLARARGLSLAAVLVIGLTFSVAALALLVSGNLSAAVAAWGRDDVLRIYLEDGAPAAEVAGLARRLQAHPRIATATVLDAETIRQRFDMAFPEMSEVTGLFEASPFPPEIEVTVVAAADVAERRELARGLKSEAGVAAVFSDDLWTARLLDLSSLVRRAGQTAGIFFAVLAALVVSGMIRLSLAARRDEMATMQVVGAPRLFIAGPFVVEGFLLGGLGGGLSVAVAGAVHMLAGSLQGTYPLAGFLALTSLPSGPALMLLAAAGAAGGLGALWAVRREMKQP